MEKIDVDLSGKTALVTGATAGIGKEIARGLAKLGATVVIAVRNKEKGDAVAKELGATVMTLDVSSVPSIKAFAAEWGEKPLHILVNNAGAWFTDRKDNAAGVELTLATNVVGPYLLTKLLEPAMRAAGKARVVNIGSGLSSNYDTEDLQWKTRKYDGFKAYAASKAALRMLTWRQAARLAPNVTANVIAPGFVKTDFNQNATGFMAVIINMSSALFAMTPEKGADTALWTCVAPALDCVTGKYLEKRKEKDGKFADPAVAADLEKRLDALIGS